MTLAKVGGGVGATLSTSVIIKRLNSTTIRQEKRIPYTGSYSSILVMVDHLTKFDYFILLTHLFTAKQVVERFVECIAIIHSMSKSIITDRG